jgi:hypothetical protein
MYIFIQNEGKKTRRKEKVENRDGENLFGISKMSVAIKFHVWKDRN